MSGIPASVLEVLQQAEPESTFEESGAHIQSSTGRLYLVKSTATAGEQYHGEAASLRLLGQAAPGLVPRLFGCFDKDGKTHFVSEFLSLNPGLSPTSTDDLANRLASEVHRFGSQNGKYGFQVPTYCGATRLSNGWFDTWDACFASLVRELLAYLRTKGPAYRVLCERGEAVCEM
jgi:protein-ribulosamine 3-kinase